MLITPTPRRAGAIFGPVLTKWLQFLNRLQFASPTRAVAYKVYLDQFVFTPGVSPPPSLCSACRILLH